MSEEYIKREAAKKAFRQELDGGYVLTNDSQTNRILDAVPAEDVVPATTVREKWQDSMYLIEQANKVMESQKRQGWISVEERLPEEEDLVLCSTGRYVYCGYVNHYDQFFVANNEYYDAWTWEPGITHWMPLPEPPEVKEND